MTTPNWIAATQGQVPLAAHPNQLLGSHAITYIYNGFLYAVEGILGGGGVNSNSLYIAQSFTVDANISAGRVLLNFAAVTGTPTAPTTLSVHTNSGSAPSATALVTTVVPPMFLNNSGNVSVPIPCSLTASTTYWLVLSPTGDASDYVSWLKSNQTSGASTSTNGTSWTAQTYGLVFALYDQTPVPPLHHTWEDGGIRWTSTWFAATAGEMNILQEYTVGQTAGDYVYSSRTLTYDATGFNIISVA